MSAPELCFRALDHKHERSDVKIVRNLVSHLQNGVLSRKERFGELFGRISSGMFRQPQDDIYVASPKDFGRGLSSSSNVKDLQDFLDWFDSEHESAHRVYITLLCPTDIDRYKHRQHVIHADVVPVRDRRIIGCIMRAQFVKQSTQDKIRGICGDFQLPVTII